jgi:hypothetical protein
LPNPLDRKREVVFNAAGFLIRKDFNHPTLKFITLTADMTFAPLQLEVQKIVVLGGGKFDIRIF